MNSQILIDIRSIQSHFNCLKFQFKGVTIEEINYTLVVSKLFAKNKFKIKRSQATLLIIFYIEDAKK